ncbi:hypothetical protein U1Q18_002318, partial [Sarracenia purpurea var. burkii]
YFCSFSLYLPLSVSLPRRCVPRPICYRHLSASPLSSSYALASSDGIASGFVGDRRRRSSLFLVCNGAIDERATNSRPSDPSLNATPPCAISGPTSGVILRPSTQLLSAAPCSCPATMTTPITSIGRPTEFLALMMMMIKLSSLLILWSVSSTGFTHSDLIVQS